MPSNNFAVLLRQRNSFLSQQLDEIRRRAFEEWIHLLKEDQGSHSGYVHLHNVERVADKMIPAAAKEQFSDGEIFLLLASILLHDLGRILAEKEGVQPCRLRGTSSGATINCEDEERHMVIHLKAEQKTHACKTRWLIQEHWAIFGLPDEKLAHLCGMICFWHQLDEPPDKRKSRCLSAKDSARSFSDLSLEPYGLIRMPLLAAILRIADETEDCWTRAIREHWYKKMEHADSAVLHKAFRRHITDVEFFPDAECVVLHVPAAGDADQDTAIALAGRANKIRQVLKTWGSCLAASGIRYRFVFVNQDGYPYDNIPDIGHEVGNVALHLERVFSKALRDPKLGLLQPGILAPGSVEQYVKRLERLVLGTGGYKDFSWSAIEGAIGEPLTAEKQWVLQWIGRIHPALKILPHLGTDRVEIQLTLTELVTETVEPKPTALVGGETD
jgi:hypothetical protein